MGVGRTSATMISTCFREPMQIPNVNFLRGDISSLAGLAFQWSEIWASGC